LIEFVLGVCVVEVGGILVEGDPCDILDGVIRVVVTVVKCRRDARDLIFVSKDDDY
jgi:hypothetical protein